MLNCVIDWVEFLRASIHYDEHIAVQMSPVVRHLQVSLHDALQPQLKIHNSSGICNSHFHYVVGISTNGLCPYSSKTKSAWLLHEDLRLQQ